MTTTSTLSEAIDRSRSHDEIVALDWSGGDESDLLAELCAIYDGEIGNVDIGPTIGSDRPVIDVWGYEGDPAIGAMDWRLNVTLTGDA